VNDNSIIILDIPITCENTSLPSECAYMYQIKKHGSFRSTIQMGEHACKCTELSLKRKEQYHGCYTLTVCLNEAKQVQETDDQNK